MFTLIVFVVRHPRRLVDVSVYSPESVILMRGDSEPVLQIYEDVSSMFVARPRVFPTQSDVSDEAQGIAPLLKDAEMG